MNAHQEKHNAQLIVALNDLDIGTRWDAASKLAAMGEDAVPVLVKLISVADWSVKHIAVWALGEIRSQHGVETLIAALNDENIHVRLSAARGLEKMDDPKARDAIASWKADLSETQ